LAGLPQLPSDANLEDSPLSCDELALETLPIVALVSFTTSELEDGNLVAESWVVELLG
jgi:hypothetical protein